MQNVGVGTVITYCFISASLVGGTARLELVWMEHYWCFW